MTRVRKRAERFAPCDEMTRQRAEELVGGTNTRPTPAKPAEARTALPFTPHSELEAGLEPYFRFQVRSQLGGKVDKLTGGGGIPDRLVLLPGGRVLLVELKTSTGPLRAGQRVWHAKAAERDVVVAVLAGKVDVDRWIQEQK